MRPWFAAVAATVVVFIAIWDQSYEGRRSVSQTLTHSQRQGCYRGMADRHANAEAWYSAYRARIDQARHTTSSTLATQYRASADVYLETAISLNSRVSQAFSVTWPEGSHSYPLGVGRVDCSVLFPLPHVSPFAFTGL